MLNLVCITQNNAECNFFLVLLLLMKADGEEILGDVRGGEVGVVASQLS